MNIHFDASRWEQVRRDSADWWAGRLDRPLIAITLTDCEPDRPGPVLPDRPFTSFYGLDVPVERIVDVWQWRLAGERYLGDAFPSVWPNFGAGTLAAFLKDGCALHNSPEGNTVWFHPARVRAAKDLAFALDENSPWFLRVRDLMREADARFEGRVQVGMADLGGNLDVLSSFRPGEQLLFDLYDCSEEVERLTWEAHDCWWNAFERLRAVTLRNPGYTAWTPIFSEEPYYMLQCDFCYMISPEMFDRFVKPELAATCRRLKNAFYHLDGIGQLPHLDSLLSIPELKGVQWVPGKGQPDITHWPEVYRTIRQAGKRIQFFADQADIGIEALDVIADQLGDVRDIAMIGSAKPADADRAMSLLERHGADRKTHHLFACPPPHQPRERLAGERLASDTPGRA